MQRFCCITHTGEHTMSKTPYEIRFDLLNLAREILQTPVHEMRNNLSDEYHSKLNDSNRGTLPYPTMPTFPSSAEIIAKAEELNKFVSGSTS